MRDDRAGYEAFFDQYDVDIIVQLDENGHQVLVEAPPAVVEQLQQVAPEQALQEAPVLEQDEAVQHQDQPPQQAAPAVHGVDGDLDRPGVQNAPEDQNVLEEQVDNAPEEQAEDAEQDEDLPTQGPTMRQVQDMVHPE